jgi:hypothetical protein
MAAVEGSGEMALQLHRTSRGLDAAALRPGEDAVLDLEPEHGLDAPRGVALDDHLSAGERKQADRAALDALAAWRAQRNDALVVDGLDVGHVAEVELIARCFLPAERLRRGLQALDTDAGVEAHGFDQAALSALSELVPGTEVTGVAAGPPPPPTRGGWRGPIVDLAERTAIPPRVRGEVLCVPYWHLSPVYERMAARRRPRPVPAGMWLAGVRREVVVGVLARNGWGGSIGARRRVQSAERVAESLTTLQPRSPMDAWALAVVHEVAGEGLAEMEHARRLLSRSVRLVVVPFDSPEHQRPLLAAARECGVPSLVVQHGFEGGGNDPDKRCADIVALWSEHDRSLLRAEARGRLEVTGNPGADRVAGVARGFDGRNRTVVLVEYPGRMTAQIDRRVTLEHLRTALAALSVCRPGSEVVVRPHPSDHATRLLLGALRTAHPGLTIGIDDSTAIEPLLRSADLCVGALSTATLQAAVLGLPTVFLDITDADRPWPFGGSGDGLPTARSEAALVAWVGKRESGAAAIAAEALGATGTATDAVLDLIHSLACR